MRDLWELLFFGIDSPGMSSGHDSESSSTSSSLIERARRNEPAAWTRLMRLYRPLVYYWCRMRAGLSPEDSADVLQTVFFAVARSVAEFQKEGERCSFRGWLRVITSNKIRDHLRRNGRQPKAAGGSDADRLLKELPAEPAELSGSSDEDAASDRALIVNRVLEELRPRFEQNSWRAFWQAEVEGRPRREIAAELQMTLAAVNQAIYRIRKRLREELDDLAN